MGDPPIRGWLETCGERRHAGAAHDSVGSAPSRLSGSVWSVEPNRHIVAGGVRLAYEVAGDLDAPPMVLLHALGERATSWEPVRDRFSEQFRVFAIDVRGHGDSDWPRTYSFQLMCDDVAEVIHQLGLRRIILLGHSMGGVVAYLLAMQRPDEVERLIVEDASPPFPRDRPIPERPDEPLDFDWAVVPAIVGQVNAGG